MSRYLNSKKIFCGALIIYFVAITLFLSMFQQVKPIQKPQKQVLTIWGWDESIVDAFYEYQKANPNVDIDFIYVNEYEYKDRINLALATGQPLPDICVLSNGDSKELLNLDIWENLEHEPYNLNRDLLLDSSISFATNSNDDVVAIPYEVSVAGIAYRNDYAKRVLKTDNPSQISVMFYSWADVLSKGSFIKQQHPDFYMFSCLQDVATILYGQANTCYIEDNTLIKASSFYNYFKILEELRYKDLVGDIIQWSPEWYESFVTEEYLFYPVALWLAQQGVFGAGNGGEWSMSVPPSGSFNWGGTVWAIPKNSNQKKLAWDFTESLLLSQAGAWYNKNKENGVLINYKPTYQHEEYQNMYHQDFGEQNIGRFYFENLLPSFKQYPISDYDTILKKVFFEVVNQMIYDENINCDQAFALFKKNIKNEIPLLIIKE